MADPRSRVPFPVRGRGNNAHWGTAACTPIAAHAPPPSTAAHKLLLWRDPVASGALAAAFALLFAVHRGYGARAPAWLAQTLAVAIVGAWVWAAVARALGRDLVPRLSILDPVDETAWVSAARSALGVINRGLAGARRLYRGEDLAASARAVGLLYALSLVLRIASPSTLLLVGVVLHLAWPPLYASHAAAIDPHLEQAKAAVSSAAATVSSTVGGLLPAALAGGGARGGGGGGGRGGAAAPGPAGAARSGGGEKKQD